MLAQMFLLVAVILGDSHAAGYPGRILSQELWLEGYDASLIDARVGRKAKDVVNKPLKLSSDITVIFIGSNDPINRNTVKSYLDLSELYPNAYVVGPPVFEDRSLDARSKIISRLQRRVFGNNAINSRRCTDKYSGRTRDGVHFTKDGAKRWVNCILSEIRSKVP
jgi:hypothetical protein